MSDLLKDLQNKTVNGSVALSALELLKTQGFPSKKLEEWHYTSPKESLAKVRWFSSKTSLELSVDLKAEIMAAKNRLVFADQGLLPELSTVTVKTAANIENKIADGMQAAGIVAFEAVMQVNISGQEKLHVFFIGNPEQFTSYALAIEISRGASLQLISKVLDDSNGTSVVVPRIQVKLHPESSCQWAHIQNQNLNSSQYSYLRAEVHEKAQLHFLGLSLGGKQVRNDIQVDIQGPDANVVLDGLALGMDDQHFDQTTGIHHHVGGSQSFQTFKSILDGHSRNAFSGTVYIAKDAQKANSEQINQNLLLSDTAEADSRPMLKIYADDVKAGHGSTVGQVNDDELFYLRSRGISKSKAIEMLAFGFAAEILFKMEDVDLRNGLENLVRNKFKGLKYQ